MTIDKVLVHINDEQKESLRIVDLYADRSPATEVPGVQVYSFYFYGYWFEIEIISNEESDVYVKIDKEE